MGWKFWKKDTEDDTQEKKQGDSAPQSNDPSQKDDQEKLSHKFLNTQIDQIIAATTESIKSHVDEIRHAKGHIHALEQWFNKKDNLIEIVLKYEKRGERPSRKDFLYGEVVPHGGVPDPTAAAEYEKRLADYLEENRPQDSLFKNWRNSSLIEKRDFLERFELFAEAIRGDITEEYEQTNEKLQDTKQKAYDKVNNIFSFYEKLRAAVDARDLDAILDISHNRTGAVVKRVLNLNLGQMEERHEIEALVKQIGVYDQIIDIAAKAAAPEEGLEVLSKIFDSNSTPEYVMQIMEDIFAQMPQTDGHPVYEAYFDYLREYIGNGLYVTEDHFVTIDNILHVQAAEGGDKALTLRFQGGIHGIAEKQLSFANTAMPRAYLRLLKRREGFLPLDEQEPDSLLNTHYVSYLDLGERPLNEDEQKEAITYAVEGSLPHYPKTAFAPTLYLRADQQGWTEVDLSHVTKKEQLSAIADAVTRKDDIECFEGLPMMRLSDIIMAKYDPERSVLKYCISGAAQDAHWFEYEAAQQHAAHFLDTLANRPSWHMMTGGWLYNLDKVQRIEYGEMPEDLESEDLNSADDECSRYFNGDTVLEIEASKLDNVLAQLDLDSAIIGEDANQAMAQLAAQAQAAEESAHTTEEEEAEASRPHILRVSTQGGMNGFMHWYDTDINEGEALSLINAVTSYKPMVKIDDYFAVNANQLYIAYAQKQEFAVQNDDNPFEADTEIKPAINLHFLDNQSEYEVLSYPLTEERMLTVIGELAGAADSYLHVKDFERTRKTDAADKFLAFVAFKDRLQALRFAHTQSENIGQDEPQRVEVSYQYMSACAGHAGFTIETAPEKLQEEYAAVEHDNMLVVTTDDNHVAAVNPKAIIEGVWERHKKAQSENKLHLGFASGSNGDHKESFNMSAAGYRVLAQDLGVCGRNETVLDRMKNEQNQPKNKGGQSMPRLAP